MSTEFSSLSHSLRLACRAKGIDLPLGHAHQLLATAFGYRSLAAFQASTSEPPSLPGGAHLILDLSALQERATALGLDTVAIAAIPQLLGTTFASTYTWGGIHLSDMGFFDYLYDQLQSFVLNDDKVIRYTADIYSDGLEEVYIPFEFEISMLPEVGDILEIPVSGHVAMRPDQDRPYRGKQVDLNAIITMERLGRRLVGDIGMRIKQAQPHLSDQALEVFNGDRLSATHAHAYADLLGMDLSLIEQLDNIDIDENTGNSGDGSYGYFLEFEGAGPDDIVNMIRTKHGRTLFQVGPNFFDGGADDLDDETHEQWTQFALEKIRECVREGFENCSASSMELIMVAFATGRPDEWLPPPASAHPAM